MAWITLLSTAGVALCTCVGYIISVTYDHRRKINELRKQGVPMPREWSWITGHLLVLQKYVDKIPSDASVTYAMKELSREYADTEVFLMDFWPVYPPLLTVFGPEPIYQVCTKYNLPKPASLQRVMKPVAGGPSMIAMNGDDWKYWRALFNPGFSSGAMLNNVPAIVDSVLTFREKLLEMVGKGMFQLDDMAMKLTMEIILKVTLDYDSNYQRSPHILATALHRITSWHSFWDPRKLLNPVRPFVQFYNGRLMDNYILKELEKRFQDIQTEDNQQTKASNKSVVALALKAYMAENKTTNILDPRFAKYVTWQIRLFIFAGTDSTASSLVYVYYMLSKHPDWLNKLRREHEEVFGEDPNDAAQLLKKEPSLLNRCHLTLAFIKETLRVYSPASTVRDGLPGTSLMDLQGKAQPTDYVGANVLHQALHSNPRLWPSPEEFLPDRFLVEPGHELHPDPQAFRPFELGPRNCIGQTLVWNELKTALVLTCRHVNITDAYEEFDAVRNKEMGMMETWKRFLFGKPIETVNGERAYQTDTGGLHPVNGYPCRVSRARGHTAS